MRCNLNSVNSWHTWSPNSRWLAFISKETSPYTQIYLTHIDPEGNDSPPVLLHRFNRPNFAVNVPEFVNIPSGGIQRIDFERQAKAGDGGRQSSITGFFRNDTYLGFVE